MKNRPPRSAGSTGRSSFDRQSTPADRRKGPQGQGGFGKKPGHFGRNPSRSAEDEPGARRYSERPARATGGSDRPFGKKPPRSRDRDEEAPRERSFSKAPQRPGSRDRKRPFDSEERSFRPRPARRDEEESRPRERSFSKAPQRPGSRDRKRPFDSEERSFRPRPARRDEEESRPRERSFSKAPQRPGSRDRKRPFDSEERSFRPRPARRDDRDARNDNFPKDSRRERQEKPRSAPAFKKAAAPVLQGAFLWGMHAVREAWLNPKREIFTLWLTPSAHKTFEPVLTQAAKQGLARPEPKIIEKENMERWLPHGSVHQGIVLDACPLPELTLDDLLGRDEAPTLIVILDQVTDPHNVGAILRSAAAFGVDAVLVTEHNAPGTTALLAKTACGALEHVPLIPVVNLARTLDTLRQESFWCIGLAEEGEADLSASKLGTGRIALALGAEGDGLRRLTREHCDVLARLPTGGPIGSLNVSNAAAVALYEVKRQKSAS